MKNRKKCFIAEFVTDLCFGDVEQEIYYAENKKAVEEKLKETLGEHLLACEVRKATWAECRAIKSTNIAVSIA